MTNNDILRSLRYMLEINNPKIVEICKLAGRSVSQNDVQNYLQPEENKDFLECPGEVLASFLDGLIALKRGKDDSRPPAPLELPVSNNLVLKKLRVAFQLQEEDMLQVLKSSGKEIGKSELSALLRKKDHRNYRECGDQVLRNFLKGMTLRLQKEK